MEVADGISIVICTYNGSHLLPETIRHIACQKFRQGIHWELILIDNASTEDVRKISISQCQKYSILRKFKVYHQPLQGLTFAREMGLLKAKFNYVLFVDDDNHLEAHYAQNAYDIMSQNRSIGVLGGHGKLVFEDKVPTWLYKQNIYANGAQDKKSGKVKNHIVYGAGFIVRKSAYISIVEAGYKPLLVDRTATGLSTGGDYELCYAMKIGGYEIWYSKHLFFNHYIASSRTSFDYIRKIIIDGAESFQVLMPYRLVACYDAQNLVSFHIGYFRLISSYSLKYFKIKLNQLFNFSNAEIENSLILKDLSVKSKITAILHYHKLKSNFVKILTYKSKVEQNQSTFFQLRLSLP
jgi:glycosyltransferase involved in cell wall biosynthesis